jgi:hypothetical protein
LDRPILSISISAARMNPRADLPAII